jgi:hypothetical protein
MQFIPISDKKSYSNFVVILCILLCACTKYEPIITPNDYKILVVDENDRPLPQVNVTFFKSEQEMRENTNPVEELKNLLTDSRGIANLRTSELSSTGSISETYYISAEYGLKNNWDSLDYIVVRNALFKPENNYTIKVVIKESLRNFIAGRNSKRWRQVGYRVNGVTQTGCDLQMTWEFYRDLPRITLYTRGQGCGIDGAARGNNIWSVNDKTATITINATPSSPPIVTDAKFTRLDSKKMNFSFMQLGILVEYLYEAE